MKIYPLIQESVGWGTFIVSVTGYLRALHRKVGLPSSFQIFGYGLIKHLMLISNFARMNLDRPVSYIHVVG